MRSGTYAMSLDRLQLRVRIDAWDDACELWIPGRGYVSTTPFGTIVTSDEFSDVLRNVWTFVCVDQDSYAFCCGDGNEYLGHVNGEFRLGPEPVSWTVKAIEIVPRSAPMTIPSASPFVIRTRREPLPEAPVEDAERLGLTRSQLQTLLAVACTRCVSDVDWGVVMRFARKTGTFERRAGPRLYLPLSLAFVTSCVTAGKVDELASEDATSEHSWLECARHLTTDACKRAHDIQNLFLARPLAVFVRT